MPNKKVQGVIFDVDGTLVDSNEAHAHAWVEALSAGGYKVSFEEILRLIGMGGDNLLPTAVKLEKESEQGQELSKRRSHIFKEKYLPTLKAFPQTREMLEHLHSQGLKLVIATSAQSAELDALLKLTGASDLFQAQTTSEDTKNSKPDPDIIQVALSKLENEAKEAIMIGDTPYDIQAATKAGVATIAFRSGGWEDADLKGAIAIYNDPADLLARYGESPLA